MLFFIFFLQNSEKSIFSEKCDVWAFGITLYEMMTRENPNDILGESEICRCNLEGETMYDVLKIKEFNLTTLYGQKCVDIMVHCWCHNPNKRPTFQEIVARSKSLVFDQGKVSPEGHSKMDWVKIQKSIRLDWVSVAAAMLLPAPDDSI